MVDSHKKRINSSGAWREAKRLIADHRSRLALGAFLMLVNRMAGFVLPAASKLIIDEVIIKGRSALLAPIALAAAAATLLQAFTAFSLSQTLSVTAQRAITEMRKKLQAHVERLPVRHFDSTQTGKLISRIMADAEGVKNLVGSGLVQLSGSLITAIISTGVLFYLNWRMTAVTTTILLIFSGSLAYAFKKLRPLFRERGEIYSRITGRLAESFGGVRIVKAYTAEKREALVFARGAHHLFRSVRKSMIGVSLVTASSSMVVGTIGVVVILIGGRSVLSGRMTLGDDAHDAVII
jgi:subfamily B ATP-binding cassette protein MsbA